MITNSVNGKQYVGQTKYSAKKRFTAHLTSAKNGAKGLLYAAVRKLGPASFRLTELAVAASQEDLDVKEILHIRLLNSVAPGGYNLSSGGSGNSHSDETRQKISESNSGREVSLDTRRRMSEAHKGVKLSSEHIAKIADANRGKKRSLEFKNRISELLQGKKLSSETRQKLSESHLGKKHSLETRRKMSEARRGKKRSIGHGRRVSIETKLKISEASALTWAEKRTS